MPILLISGDALTVRERCLFVKLLADECFDGETLQYRDVDLGAAVENVCKREQIRLNRSQYAVIVADVAAALPVGAAPFPDPWTNVTEWLAARAKAEAESGYRGALHDLLNHAWRRLAEQAGSEPAAVAVPVSSDPLEAARAQLSIAGSVFVLAHDGRSGVQSVPDSALGLGVAAGLVAELLLAGHVVLDPRGRSVRVFSEAERLKSAAFNALWERLDPEDESERSFAELLTQSAAELAWPPAAPGAVTRPAARVLDVLAQGETGLGKLLVHVAGSAAQRVREHLVEAGVVVWEESRRLLDRRSYCRPIEPRLRDVVYGAVAAPFARGQLPGGMDAVVLELVRACGLAVAQHSDWWMLERAPRGAALDGMEHYAALRVLTSLVEAEVTAVVSSPGI